MDLAISLTSARAYYDDDFMVLGSGVPGDLTGVDDAKRQVRARGAGAPLARILRSPKRYRRGLDVLELPIVREDSDPDPEVQKWAKPNGGPKNGISVASKELKAIRAPKRALEVDVAADVVVVGLKHGERDLHWLSIIELRFPFAEREAGHCKARECRARAQVEVLDLVLSISAAGRVADQRAFDIQRSPLNERQTPLKKPRIVERKSGGVEPNGRTVRRKTGVRRGHTARALAELKRLVVGRICRRIAHGESQQDTPHDEAPTTHRAKMMDHAPESKGESGFASHFRQLRDYATATSD